MEENRRQSDKRMDSMEKDIRELRDGQKDMQEDITLIREKIFNGFSHAITESHENSKEIRSAVEKLNNAVTDMHAIVYRTPEEILATCPFKKEVQLNYEKKLTGRMIIIGLVITLLVGLPAWIEFILGKIGG